MTSRPLLTLRRAAAPEPEPKVWLCKPCGARVPLAEGLADTAVIRCPACTARLGVYADFANPSPTFARLRARPAPARVKPATGPRAGVVVERKVRRLAVPPRLSDRAGRS
jgi:DNA-directed RNA polymerase subunit RPC12/RpoP